jgi:hypothetical protein
MTIEYIFETFRALETVAERVTYLQELATLSLPYDINYEALIRAWLVSE